MDKASAALLHQRLGLPVDGIPAGQKHWRARVVIMDMVEHLTAVDDRHDKIQNDQVKVFALVQIGGAANVFHEGR